jgi:hypothetical protein
VGNRPGRAFAALFAVIICASMSPLRALAMQEVYLGAGSITLGSSATSIQLAPGYGYSVLPWLQGTAAANINISNFKETSVKTLTFYLGPTFNIGPFDNATFVFLGLALRLGSASPDPTDTSSTSTTTTSSSSSSSSDAEESTSTYDDPTGAGIALFAGKRFVLTGKLTFRPSIGLQQVGTLNLVINALALSYSF